MSSVSPIPIVGIRSRHVLRRVAFLVVVFGFLSQQVMTQGPAMKVDTMLSERDGWRASSGVWASRWTSG